MAVTTFGTPADTSAGTTALMSAAVTHAVALTDRALHPFCWWNPIYVLTITSSDNMFGWQDVCKHMVNAQLEARQLSIRPDCGRPQSFQSLQSHGGGRGGAAGSCLGGGGSCKLKTDLKY